MEECSLGSSSNVVAIEGVTYEMCALQPLPREESQQNAYCHVCGSGVSECCCPPTMSGDQAYVQHVQRNKLKHTRATRKRSSPSTRTGRNMMDNIPIPVQTLDRYGADEREQLLRDAGVSGLTSRRDHHRDHNLSENHHHHHGPEAEEEGEEDHHHHHEEGGEEEQRQQIVSDAAIEEAMMEAVKRRRLMEGGSMGRADADWVDEPPKKSKQTGRSYWVPSIDKWHEDFGHVRVSTDPVHPSPLECFGCGYEDTNSEANAIYAEKWNRLLTKFTECCANSSSPAVMARDLHDLFVRDFVSQMVTDNIENAHVIARNWTPYKMLYHMFFHNRDTNIAASNKIAWLHELQRTIVENELYKEHAVTGRRKVCKKGLKKLDTALKMELPWVKLKPDEMGFSVPRRQVNPNSISLLSSRVKQIEASRLARYNNPWK